MARNVAFVVAVLAAGIGYLLVLEPNLFLFAADVTVDSANELNIHSKSKAKLVALIPRVYEGLHEEMFSEEDSLALGEMMDRIRDGSVDEREARKIIRRATDTLEKPSDSTNDPKRSLRRAIRAVD